MSKFKKFIKANSIPATARKFENGDVCIKREEYIKGEQMFGYYHPTKAGYGLERTMWKGNHASRYNWSKVNNPDFTTGTTVQKPAPALPKIKSKPTLTTKKAVAKSKLTVTK